MAAISQHRRVFVGNIPYNATEEQLKQICEEIGPVVSFRLVIDKETGKKKGYGFCEYKDEETALSARRNLQGYKINGSQLRVDFAENDKNTDKSRDQGRGGPGMAANIDSQKRIGGQGVVMDSDLNQPLGIQVAMAAAAAMGAALGGAQSTPNSFLNNGLQSQPPVVGTDPLTLHMAKLSRKQLNEMLSDIKVMATENKEQARQLLLSTPQLSKAILLAQMMLGMVSQQMLKMPNIQHVSAPVTPAHFISNQQPQVANNNPAWPRRVDSSQTLPLPKSENPDPIIHRPSKMAKLGDGKIASTTSLPSTSQPASVPNTEKQVPQFAPDMEAALLEQIRNLTPEQLSSLHPEQKQQVIMLQQMLRQPNQFDSGYSFLNLPNPGDRIPVV